MGAIIESTPVLIFASVLSGFSGYSLVIISYIMLGDICEESMRQKFSIYLNLSLSIGLCLFFFLFSLFLFLFFFYFLFLWFTFLDRHRHFATLHLHFLRYLYCPFIFNHCLLIFFIFRTKKAFNRIKKRLFFYFT